MQSATNYFTETTLETRRLILRPMLATDLGALYLISVYWNRGFATEAASAVRDYAFDVLQLPKLVGLIRFGNIASKRVAEKAGMQFVEEFMRYEIRYWKYALERK